MIPHVLSTLALIGPALLLGATIYQSVVMAPNYERDILTSIELAPPLPLKLRSKISSQNPASPPFLGQQGRSRLPNVVETGC
jgi:hypothetical protein